MFSDRQREISICRGDSGLTIASSVVGADGVSFVAAALKSWNQVAAGVMTATIEQRALVNV